MVPGADSPPLDHAPPQGERRTAKSPAPMSRRIRIKPAMRSLVAGALKSIPSTPMEEAYQFGFRQPVLSCGAGRVRHIAGDLVFGDALD